MVGEKVETRSGVIGVVKNINFDGDLYWVEYDDDPEFGAYYSKFDLTII